MSADSDSESGELSFEAYDKDELYEFYAWSVRDYAGARGVPAPSTPRLRVDSGSATGIHGDCCSAPVKVSKPPGRQSKAKNVRDRTTPTTKYVGAYTSLYLHSGAYIAARGAARGLACVVRPTQAPGRPALLAPAAPRAQAEPRPSKKARVLA